MSNTVYNNFVLENKIEDMLTTKVDLNAYITPDRSLTENAGMKKVINVYTATGNVEDLAQGAGNSGDIEVSFTPAEYTVQVTQGRFTYYDEEAMNDTMVVLTGSRHMATDMFNTVNGDAMAEFEKAQIVVIPVASDFFGAFVDAQAAMNVEANDAGAPATFALVKPSMVATLRKVFKDDLKYVEAYVRSGYIGTVGGTNIYVTKIAGDSDIVVATKQAVTIFNKKGVEVESLVKGSRGESAANTRLNTLFSRKYYIAALTDATKAVKIAVGATATLSADTTVSSSKTYYEAVGTAYVEVTPAAGDNPTTKGWYEISFQ
jgi:hypothetical protein